MQFNNKFYTAYNSQTSCHSVNSTSIAFSFGDVWYFSLPKPIVTNTSFLAKTKHHIYILDTIHIFSYNR